MVMASINANKSKSLAASIPTFLTALSFMFLSLLLNADDTGIENLKKTGKAFANVAKKVSPAVVFLKIEKEINSYPGSSRYDGGHNAPGMNDEMLRQFFGVPPMNPRRQGEKQTVVGQGSGFIITPDGYILTANHVVAEADNIKVKFQDEREFNAKIIGKDPQSDIAVIKIEGTGFPFVELGDSDDLEVGEWVVAIGNPFGLSHSLTAGIVSAKGRSAVGIADYENFIQTDAAINPGNSGGPLVNLDSQVVGMNSAIFSSSGGYMGIGFAIPANMIKAIKDQLIKNGMVTRGQIGIVIQDITPELAEMFKVKDAKGILISQVMKGAPADKAGLKSGDVILKLNETPVENISSFRGAIAMIAPGTKTKLTILRNDKTKEITLTVGNQNDPRFLGNDAEIFEKLGFQIRNLSLDIAERLGYTEEQGVVISEVLPNSPAAGLGLRPGTLILSVNHNTVKNIEDFRQVITAAESNNILLFVRNGQFSSFVVMRLK